MKKIGYINANRNRFPKQMWAEYPVLVLPDEMVEYLEHFVQKPSISETDAAAAWRASIVDSGNDNAEKIIIANNGRGGWLYDVTNDANGDSNSLQLNGEQFKFAAGKKMWFEARIRIDDVDKANLYFGLHIEDIEPYGGVTDGVAFRMDHDGRLDCVTEKDSTETVTDSGVDMADDTFIKIGWFFDGAGTIYFFIDDVLVATHTTNIPDDEELAVGFEIETAEAVAHYLNVDYIKVAQLL